MTRKEAKQRIQLVEELIRARGELADAMAKVERREIALDEFDSMLNKKYAD